MTLPANATIDAYGGIKQDDAPVVDISTDESAVHRNEYVADVTGMTHTAVRAWCTFKGTATSPPDDPATNIHGAVWGGAIGVKPVVARTGTGVYTLTWLATVSDLLSRSQGVSFRWALKPNVDGATLYHATATVTGANVITVRVFNSAGTANDAVGANITVCAL